MAAACGIANPGMSIATHSIQTGVAACISISAVKTALFPTTHSIQMADLVYFFKETAQIPAITTPFIITPSIQIVIRVYMQSIFAPATLSITTLSIHILRMAYILQPPTTIALSITTPAIQIAPA